MHIILLGAPGVGKGTQAKLIMAKFSIPQISTGDILRAEIKNETGLGKQVKSILESGELVSEGLILQIVENRLKQPDCENGFILDGFPRTIPQADGLAEILKRLGDIHLRVIEVSVPDAEIIKRLTSRRTCSNCGTMYNMVDNPPASGNICTVCGGNVVQRDDDKAETIQNRLAVYRKNTEPLIEYYKKHGEFFKVNGMQSIESVFEDVLRII